LQSRRTASIYIGDEGNQRVRWVGAEGVIAHGCRHRGVSGFSGEGGTGAAGETLRTHRGGGRSGRRALYRRPLSTSASGASLPRCRAVRRTTSLLASSDGREVYVFSAAGRPPAARSKP
jgi:hypothetical protein